MNFTFINMPKDLKCVICLSVAEDPLQHEECGQLFCNKCIERYGKDKVCPHCMTEGLFFTDKKSKFECFCTVEQELGEGGKGLVGKGIGRLIFCANMKLQAATS
jgi:hypothetical protein